MSALAHADHGIERHGFCICPAVLSVAECAAIIEELGPVARAGRRGLLSLPEIARIAHSPKLMELTRRWVPSPPRPVRAIFFDKSPETNWLVAWHQDLTIAVRERRETPGFGPWSIKEGVPHVQPPVECLQRMITVRLHLDDADETNGALRVLPGSQAEGRLSAEQIRQWREAVPEVTCCVSAGGALLMRPLLLHASGRSQSPRHRRVLHLEYAAFDLPAGLEWQEGLP